MRASFISDTYGTIPKVKDRPANAWVVIPLYIGTALLVYHQRVGWQDEGGADWLQVALRPESWFAFSVVLSLIVIPKWTLWPRARFGGARTVLFWAPLAALMAALLSTGLADLRYTVAYDVFGAQVPVRMLLGISFGILVFNLALINSQFAARMIVLLTWMPFVSIMLGILSLIVPVTFISGQAEGIPVEGWGLTYGARFQGLTSNPNMAATTSSIAVALLLPRILQGVSARRPTWAFFILYVLGLLAVMVLSGVRAMLVVLVVVGCVALWLRFRLTARGLMSVCFTALKLVALAVLAAFILLQTGLAEVLAERIGSDDGRLFLWQFYINLLWENPLGLGFGFETIVDTENIIPGQRLPPHNTLLQMAMYGGFVGLVVHLFVLGKVIHTIAWLRRAVHPAMLSNSLQALILGWCALVVSLLFGGLIFIDHHFVILTALLLAAGARAVPSLGLSRERSSLI